MQNKLETNYLETDVLVIGGGLGGCAAAVKLRNLGLKVILLEKSAVERSGSSGQGIDHFGVLFPRDGLTPEQLTALHSRWQTTMTGAKHVNLNLIYNLFNHGALIFEEWDRMGVTMKWDDGEPNWLPWPRMGFPIKRVSLRVHWQNVKPELAKAVRKSGTISMDRVLLIDLLTDNNTVVGATAYNSRSGEFYTIKSKATIVATGWVNRIFDAENPMSYKYKMRYHTCPASGSGDSWGAVYRAGGEMANMDINVWTPRLRDDLTCSYGNFRLNDGVPMRCLTWDGEEIINPGPLSYAELERQGKTPIYYSLENLNDTYHKRIEVAYADERPMSYKIAEERGFNPRNHWYELNQKPLCFTHWNGIFVDSNCRATLKNLYASGDCVASLQGCAFASGSGIIAAMDIVENINKFNEGGIDKNQEEQSKELILKTLGEKDGVEPMELECSIRYIVERYMTNLRSEGKIREGLRRLGSLRREWLPKLMASNPHYVMRALECRNLMDIAELHFMGCLERKETRGGYVRLDYPDVDHSLDDKCCFQSLQNGKPILEFKPMPELKPEYQYFGEVK